MEQKAIIEVRWRGKRVAAALEPLSETDVRAFHIGKLHFDVGPGTLHAFLAWKGNTHPFRVHIWPHSLSFTLETPMHVIKASPKRVRIY